MWKNTNNTVVPLEWVKRNTLQEEIGTIKKNEMSDDKDYNYTGEVEGILITYSEMKIV